MKMRNMIAAVAAMAVSAVAVVALPASAAEKTIAYTASEGSLGVGDDGTSLRRNIYNTWGNNVTDIDGATAVNEYLTVTFNVSGIGSDSADADGNAYYVFLGGSIAGVAAHQSEYNAGSVTGSQVTAITGDGQYTVTWETSSENIDCLYLQSNINIYAYGEDAEAGTKATCVIDVVSIVTDDGVEETQAPETTTTADGTTTAGTTTTAGGTTTTAKGGASTTTTAASTTNTTTGDNSGIAVAVAALAVAGGVALVSKKRK